jgi:hypothetical protein
MLSPDFGSSVTDSASKALRLRATADLAVSSTRECDFYPLLNLAFTATRKALA